MNTPTRLAFCIAAALNFPAMAEDITGIVVDKSGLPIPQAKISLLNSNEFVYADDQGNFRIEDLKDGIVELHITADKFSHVNQTVELRQQHIDKLRITLSPSVFDIIDIHATPLHGSSVESTLPVNVLSGDDLRMKQASTLGETLKNEVGVHSSYFGPVSSSPIIRGLDGPRVMITQNGLDAGDASRVGPDHAVSSESSTATQIEVLRGPATLFYGSGAIGGVVNVVDNRIPHDNESSAEWLLEHNTVADENAASASFNAAQAQWAWHVDGFWRQSNNYKLAGPAELAHDDDAHDDEAQSDTLDSSSAKSAGFTLGSSYLLENGFVGLSYGRTDRRYDVPGHGTHEEEAAHEAEADEETEVYADLKQNRYQLISELAYDGQLINAIHSKFAYTDYLHKEIENAQVGTTFDNTSLEGRVDLFHREISGWSGALSLHYKSSDFTAIGEEAFTPPSETQSWAMALLEEKHFGKVLIQLGVRLEHIELNADPVTLTLAEEDHEEEEHEEEEHEEDHEDLIEFRQQSFNPFSLSAGLVWDFQPGYNFAVSLSHSQRAPSASELFSFGPHIGTNSFEIGSLFTLHQADQNDFHIDLSGQSIDMEKANNLDFTLRKYEGDFGFVFNVFYNRIDDFYYQQNSGLLIAAGHGHGEDPAAPEQEEESLLPLLLFTPGDVEMYGYEAELAYQLNNEIKISAFSDTIRGKLRTGDNLPRIPPTRLGLSFNYEGDDYNAELSATHYFEQDQTSAEETTTAAYTLLDMHVNYYFDSDSVMGDIILYFKGQNLTDEHARVHSSFLKDVVPLPGRGFSIGLRGGF